MITDRIASAIEVNDTNGLRIDCLHSIIASLRQSGILLHVLLSTPHRPEESMRSLIAHLHPIHVNLMVLQELKCLTGMLCQRLTHLLIAHLFPGLGYILLARISPPVAVMEVDHDGHTLFLGTKCQLQHILLAAETSLGIHPDTESGSIQTIFTHQNGVLTRFALCIVKLHTMSLQGGSAADIGSQPECVIGRHRPYRYQ